MRKYSEAFGTAISAMLDSLGLSQSKASQATKGLISGAYFGYMRGGTVPSYEVMKVIHETFGEAAREVVSASGYSFPEPVSSLGNIDLPPGARVLVGGTPGLRVGPPVSAGSGNDDTGESHDRMDWSQMMLDRGAVYTVPVDGDCLAPDVPGGAHAAVRPANSASSMDRVVARLPDDRIVMKVYKEDADGPYITTAANNIHIREFKVIGVIVGHMVIG